MPAPGAGVGSSVGANVAHLSKMHSPTNQGIGQGTPWARRHRPQKARVRGDCETASSQKQRQKSEPNRGSNTPMDLDAIHCTCHRRQDKVQALAPLTIHPTTPLGTPSLSTNLQIKLRGNTHKHRPRRYADDQRGRSAEGQASGNRTRDTGSGVRGLDCADRRSCDTLAPGPFSIIVRAC